MNHWSWSFTGSSVPLVMFGASVAGPSEAAGAEVSSLLLLSLPHAAATRASAAAATRPLLMLPIFLTMFLPLVLLLM